MRAVVQRVRSARVTVASELVGEIAVGLCVLVGVENGDTARHAQELADKLVGLRIFEDEFGKMNRSVDDIGGALLLISQFTLLGDARRGRRPGFSLAMSGPAARELFDVCVNACRASGRHVEQGRFGADMLVEINNDGPVTILLDTNRRF
jgi:D-aminoacyl-tRNA deacylase